MTPRAVLFDCDGVLADSEGLVNRVVAEDLSARGWSMTGAEARITFLGMALPDMLPVIERRIGKLPPAWGAELSGLIASLMARAVEPVAGARAAVAACLAAGLPIAVASNSARRELAAKLHRLDLAHAFGHRVFSYEDVPRPKPWPDMYLAAAASCAAAPQDCVVVEDSVPGVRAGIAAGCRVLGFAQESPAAALAAAGAITFGAMHELPGLLGLAPPARNHPA